MAEFLYENVHEVTVSAPGKVLLAGGYLVLEESNIGVTVATSARFYTSIKHSKHDQSTGNAVNIIVRSPQFASEFEYLYHPYEMKLDKLGASNTFVEKCLNLTFVFLSKHMPEKEFAHSFLHHTSGGFLDIKLRADNDFYSQIKTLKSANEPLLSSSLEKLPKFLPCPIVNGEVQVAKTGLGSSAALTTSLVAALLQWFGAVHLETTSDLQARDADRRIVHNLAQLVHANAQGKIGSGFDVAAAVYGTQTYKRFSATAFNNCLEGNVSPEVLHSAVMATDPALGWSQTISAFSLPPGLVMVLGDVCGGSSSTSMAKEVLRWRAERPVEAGIIWNALSSANTAIAQGFATLNALHASDAEGYRTSLQWASTHTVAEWTEETQQNNAVVSELARLRTLFKTAREELKKMGEWTSRFTGTSVDIEPDAQTRLADATDSITGVLCALVPGAGGVDALVAIALSEEVRSAVEHTWAEWDTRSGDEEETYASVCPLVLRAESSTLSGVVVI